MSFRGSHRRGLFGMARESGRSIGTIFEDEHEEPAYQLSVTVKSARSLRDGDSKRSFFVVSSGPDKTLDTDDDLRLEARR